MGYISRDNFLWVSTSSFPTTLLRTLQGKDRKFLPNYSLQINIFYVYNNYVLLAATMGSLAFYPI